MLQIDLSSSQHYKLKDISQFNTTQPRSPEKPVSTRYIEFPNSKPVKNMAKMVYSTVWFRESKM